MSKMYRIDQNKNPSGFSNPIVLIFIRSYQFDIMSKAFKAQFVLKATKIYILYINRNVRNIFRFTSSLTLRPNYFIFHKDTVVLHWLIINSIQLGPV